MSQSDFTTVRKVISRVKAIIEDDSLSDSGVHIFQFNLPLEHLASAVSSLDKQDGRGSMRVTFNDDYNFIVKYMPGRVHQVAISTWDALILQSLLKLTKGPLPPGPLPPGCMGIRGITFDFEGRKKEADGGIGLMRNFLPSVVLKVGNSETLTQLRIDARQWLEKMPTVELVVLLLISESLANPPSPVITIELWKGCPPQHMSKAGEREAHKVWSADWTNNATPLYILLSDIFKGQVPSEYSDETDRIYLDTVAFRQHILDVW